MKRSLLVFLAGISIQAGWAQTPPASPAPPVSSPSPATAAAPADNASTTLDYLFDHKPGDGTTAAAAKNTSGTLADKLKAMDSLNPPGINDPAVQAQFETYLSLPETSTDRIAAYGEKMRHVSDTLKDSDLASAWRELCALSDYQDMDAGLSGELAHQVELIFNNGQVTLGLNQANDHLRQLIDTYDWNADQISQKIQQEEALKKKKKGDPDADSEAPPSSDPLTMVLTLGGVGGKLELSNEYMKILDAKTQMKLNDFRVNYISDQGRSDFASYIGTLFSGHHYDQVILAANFYRRLFHEDNYPASITEEVNTSLETNRQVVASLEAFRHQSEQGAVAGAAQSLLRAFVGSPYHPALQGVPRAQKERVHEYLVRLGRLKNALEVRDFGQVETLVTSLKQEAKDFDATKPMALVNDSKVECNFYLNKAKLLAQQGNLSEAMAQFQASADVWPGNPDLQAMADSFFQSQDLKIQAINDFDRLAQAKNYRAIFDRQIVFAPVIAGNVIRERQLKTALETVGQAKMSVEQAKRQAAAGDICGAWETIDSALQVWPDDQKLNQCLADLSARGPDFVTAINRARDAEASDELGYSLTWYVKAKTFYPPSRVASTGIDRVSKQILTSHGPDEN